MVTTDYRIDNNSIILPKIEEGYCSYSEKMILKADIPNVIRPKLKHFNNSEYYCYDIENRVSFEDYYNERTIEDEMAVIFLTELARIKSTLAEYLLNYSHILLLPDTIFLNINDNSIWFCLLPFEQENVSESFSKTALFLMDKIDSKNEKVVNIIYEYYENVQNEIFDPQCLLAGCINNIKEEHSEVEYSYEDTKETNITEEYYFIEPKEIDEEISGKELLNPLIICASIILFMGLAYSVVFLNPKILSVIGISQENYIVIGAALAFVLSLILYFIIKIYAERIEKKAKIEKKIEEELQSKRMRAGTMEQKEYQLREIEKNKSLEINQDFCK